MSNSVSETQGLLRMASNNFNFKYPEVPSPIDHGIYCKWCEIHERIHPSRRKENNGKSKLTQAEFSELLSDITGQHLPVIFSDNGDEESWLDVYFKRSGEHLLMVRVHAKSVPNEDNIPDDQHVKLVNELFLSLYSSKVNQEKLKSIDFGTEVRKTVTNRLALN